MAATKREASTSVTKDRAIAFVNWTVGGIRSSKGFALYDNQYTTTEEAALVELAKKHGGTVRVMAELRIIISGDKPESYDIDSIEVLD